MGCEQRMAVNCECLCTRASGQYRTAPCLVPQLQSSTHLQLSGSDDRSCNLDLTIAAAIVSPFNFLHLGLMAGWARVQVAYVPQSAFIFGETVRNNILFGLPYEAERYQRAIDVACLGPDLASLQGGHPDGLFNSDFPQDTTSGIVLPSKHQAHPQSEPMASFISHGARRPPP